MSSSLLWEPVERKQDDLPHALKFALRKRFGEPVDIIADESTLSYLHGLYDANIQGAGSLIKAIERHGSVHVWEQY